MNNTTNGEIISQIRNQIKAVRQDAFLTDRFIYSIISKHAAWLMKREDSTNKLMRFNSIFQTLDSVELEEVDRIEAAQCVGISSGYTLMRTKDSLPIFRYGYWGPLIRRVMSIDGQIEFQPISATNYNTLSRSKNFKYNKTHYYWYSDGRLYFPDISWPAISVEGVFDDDIEKYKCPDCEDAKCKKKQELSFNVPDYLYAEMQSRVLQEMFALYQIPPDQVHDNQNPLR